MWLSNLLIRSMLIKVRPETSHSMLIKVRPETSHSMLMKVRPETSHSMLMKGSSRNESCALHFNYNVYSCVTLYNIKNGRSFLIIMSTHLWLFIRLKTAFHLNFHTLLHLDIKFLVSNQCQNINNKLCYYSK